MNHRSLLISLFCLINLSFPVFAKEWRNIFPLKTTRAVVIKLLGEPQRSEATEGEYFKVNDGIVKIRWKRTDCFTPEVVTSERSLKKDFLVYQITFLPNDPLSLDWVESEKTKADNDDSEIPANAKSEAKAVYKKWVAYDVNCTIGADDTACGIMGYGFGYSTNKTGITALYYYPTKKESETWKQNLQPCSFESK